MEASIARATDAEIFVHVRILLGVVVSLSIARLLSGLAEFVQHPGRKKPDVVHLLWVLGMLLTLVHFWWWELALVHRSPWRFEIYAFVLFYATLNYLLCAVLFPNDLHEYTGFRDYFESRRVWFFGLLALSFAADVIDTLIKGHDYWAEFSSEYPIRVGVYLLLFAVAATVRHRGFHLVFAGASLAYQVSWILRVYDRAS
jgi:hypothetical protein